MQKDTKIMIWIGVITLAIIGVGVYFLSKPPKSSNELGEKVNQELLVRSDSRKIKAPNEKAVLVEFGDFQCPACASYHTLTKKLTEEFKDELTFVFRNYPLPQHKYAQASSRAAEAAGNQGKYFEMFDLLYENQDKWTASGNAENIFRDYAKNLNLDLARYDNDIKSNDVQKRIDNDRTDGDLLGVNSTPTFYLNGEKIGSVRSYEDFQTLVKAAILKTKVSITVEPKYHAHFDLVINLNGKLIDLALPKYQSTEKVELDPDVHVHDGNGKVVHVHKKGITLGQFLKSLKMNMSDTCFTTDLSVKNCNAGEKILKMFVNGKENKDFDKYIPQDLDRILITYGNEGITALQKQIDSVSDVACIYSEKCPERGKPPVENCVGGLGSGCDKEE